MSNDPNEIKTDQTTEHLPAKKGDTSISINDPDVRRALELHRISTKLFMSDMYPAVGNQYGAFAVVLFGDELGVRPMTSLQNIVIIKGKPAMSTSLMLTLARRGGVTWEVLDESDTVCSIKFMRDGREYLSKYTWEEAQRANLTGKDNYKHYPRDMMFWRAASRGIRRIAPDVLGGALTVDELTNGNYVEVGDIPETVRTIEQPVRASLDITNATAGDPNTHQGHDPDKSHNNPEPTSTDDPEVPQSEPNIGTVMTELMQKTKDELIKIANTEFAGAFLDDERGGSAFLQARLEDKTLSSDQWGQNNKGQLARFIVALRVQATASKNSQETLGV